MTRQREVRNISLGNGDRRCQTFVPDKHETKLVFADQEEVIRSFGEFFGVLTRCQKSLFKACIGHLYALNIVARGKKERRLFFSVLKAVGLYRMMTISTYCIGASCIGASCIGASCIGASCIGASCIGASIV